MPDAGARDYRTVTGHSVTFCATSTTASPRRRHVPSLSTVAGAGSRCDAITFIRVGFSVRLQEATLAARTLSDGTSDTAGLEDTRRSRRRSLWGGADPSSEQIFEAGALRDCERRISL